MGEMSNERRHQLRHGRQAGEEGARAAVGIISTLAEEKLGSRALARGAAHI